MKPPVIIDPIPDQVVNEKAYFGPLNLNQFIAAVKMVKLEKEPHEMSEEELAAINADMEANPEKYEEDLNADPVTFSAGLSSGDGLPDGFICTPEGEISGIAKEGTLGSHEIKITASNEAGSVEATFRLTVKETLAASTMDSSQIDLLKAEAWKALEGDLPLPDLQAIYERNISPIDVYYLLERWGTLTIYNAYDLNPPGEKKAIELPGVSKHYQVYDRGCCLVSVPKKLFSHERTLADALQTARVMAREVYKREWAVELIGFEKFTRAAWVEIQLQVDKHGKELEIINYNPTADDINLYTKEALSQDDGPEAPTPG